VYVGLAVLFSVGLKNVPVTWIGVGILVMQYFVLLPIICDKYYKAYNNKIGISRFIPIWNEISLFNGKVAVLSLVSYVLLLCVGLTVLIPSSVIDSVFGDYVMFNFYVWVMRAEIILVIFNAVITGIGYLSVNRNVNQLHSNLIGKDTKISFVEVVFYVLYFVPIIRVAPVSHLLDRLNKLVVLNNYRYVQEDVQLEEV
jgi:hypothetical protein